MTSDEAQSYKAFYKNNGYVVIDDIYSPEECDYWAEFFERYADKDYSGLMNLDRTVPEARKLMTNPRTTKILDELQHAVVMGLQLMYLFKKAGSPYANQAWNLHQDNAYAGADCGCFITVSIAFAAQSPENGGLYLYPGSHRLPVLPNVPSKSFHEDVDKNPGHTVQVPEGYVKTDLIMKKGSAMFLHGNCIHGSYANKSDRDRPTALVATIIKGKKFIVGKTGKRYEIELERA